MITQTHEQTEYDTELAKVAAIIIDHMNEVSLEGRESSMSFMETYNLKKGVMKFGEKGSQAAYKEMKQLHDRVCFKPINTNTLTPTERKRALESLLFLVEKKTGEVKARTVANGSVQRIWMNKEESSSPTVSTTGLFITLAVDAKDCEKRSCCEELT